MALTQLDSRLIQFIEYYQLVVGVVRNPVQHPAFGDQHDVKLVLKLTSERLHPLKAALRRERCYRFDYDYLAAKTLADNHEIGDVLERFGAITIDYESFGLNREIEILALEPLLSLFYYFAHLDLVFISNNRISNLF